MTIAKEEPTITGLHKKIFTSAPSRRAVRSFWMSAVIIGVFLAKSALPVEAASPSPIPVGSSPVMMAYDAANGDVYVANFASNTVSVIDGTTNTVISTIAVGSKPIGVAYDAKNGDVYLANNGSTTVSVIDGSTNTVTSTITVGTQPFGAAYDAANGDVYVANVGDDSVSVIDGSTNAVKTTISVGTWPYGVGYDAANGDVYVANNGAGTVSVIDGSTNTVTSTISMGKGPYGVAYDAANGDVYVANNGTTTVSVIDGSTNTVTSTISVGSNPFGVAYDATNGDVYATNNGSNNVSMIDGSTNTVTSTISVGSKPFDVVYDTTNGDVYVTNLGSNNVSVIVPAPQGLSTSNTTSTGTTLTWNSVTGASSYNVYENGGSTPIATGVTGTSYAVTGLTPGTSYTFTVSAVSSSGESAQSNSLSVNTVPSAPSGLSMSNTTSTGTTLSWTASSGATSYNIYENGGSTALATGVTTTSYTVTGLTTNTGYHFTVSAVNSGGESAQSASVSLTTTPSAPTGLASSGTTQTGTTLTWTAPTGATSYNIYESGSSTALATGVSTTSYSVTGLTANTDYTFTVSAVNAGGESAQSSSTSVMTLPNAPGAPTGVAHASVTTNGWTESWSVVGGASSYNVYVNGTKVNSSPITGTSYTVTGQASRTTFTVAVTAINPGGDSPQATDTVTTLAPPPPRPLPSSGGSSSSSGDTSGGGSDIQVSVNGSTQSVSTDGGQASKDTGTTTVDVTVPKGAMPGGDGIIINIVDPKTIIPTVPVQQPTKAPTTKPTMVVGVKVSFTGATPVIPITVTIHNANVQAGGVLYKVLPDDTLVPMNATVTNGQIVVTFSTDPNFVLVNPPKVIGLTSYERVIVLNGQVFVVPSRVNNNTTYIPIWYVMQVMKKLDMSSIWTGTDWYLATNSPTNMSNVSPGNGTMHMYLNGTLVQANDKQAWNDPFSGKKTTYVPIWYLMQLLTRVHVTNMWDGKEWVLIPNS